MDIILKYFPNLTQVQIKQFDALYELYLDWNSKINVISRKDIENLYEHHILHSLAIAKLIEFKPGTKILDLGTGGGFPGIPLAILFPDVNFLLNDRINKKLTVASSIAEAIGLVNVSTRHCGAEEIKESFDFVVSRAVMPLEDLIKIINKKISPTQINALPNGLICLKGGNLTSELAPFKNKAILTELEEYFEEEFFSTKAVVYVPLVATSKK
ncbi:MAG: 16S rRNA (guanine(527)-N(7))-methyltransferase RsmG [Bacteroidales bacterium]